MPATKTAPHTPGPWRYQPAVVGVPADALVFPHRGTYPIAEVIQMADAPLIAAAPELLAELRAAHQIIRNALAIMDSQQKTAWGELNATSNVDGEGITRANERAAAIAKAEGRP